MHRSILIALALPASLFVPRTSPAQEPRLQPGARVRVSAPRLSRAPFVGIVDTTRADTIVVRTSPEGRYSIPLAAVSRIEISRGLARPMWSKTAPLWLTGVGAGTGAICGYMTTPEDDYFGPGTSAAVFGIFGALLGLLMGTSLAIVVKEDQWEPVDASASGSGESFVHSMYLSPSMRGMQLGLRFTF